MSPRDPRAGRNPVRLRIWLISKYFKLMATPKSQRKFTVSDLCESAGISRKTFYKWLNRYKDEGEAGLIDRPRRPKKIKRTPAFIISLVYETREKFNWGAKKIESHLKRQYGIKVSHTTIQKYLELGGYVKRQKQNHYRRWSRGEPNELWQIDISGSGRLDIIDDASRFLIASVQLEHATADAVVRITEACFERFGSPREILSDRGTQFYSVRGGKSQFDELCERWGVRHILASPAHPQTIGKVERLHRTIDYERWWLRMSLAEYSEHYNYVRPHGGIEYAPPAERYFNGKQLRVSSVTHLP